MAKTQSTLYDEAERAEEEAEEAAALAWERGPGDPRSHGDGDPRLDRLAAEARQRADRAWARADAVDIGSRGALAAAR